MAMLLGPANSFIMVDVREGALPSNYTIPMLSLFPCIKYKHSKNKMLHVLQMTVPFYFQSYFFSVVVGVHILTQQTVI
jgi:hypothetical protein